MPKRIYKLSEASAMFSGLNSRLFKKISFRLTIFYALLFVVSSFLIFTLNYFLLDQSLKSRDHGLLSTKLKEYAYVYSKGGLDELKNHLVEETKGDEDSQILVRVESSVGKTLFLHMSEKMKNLPSEEVENKFAAIKQSNTVSIFEMKDVDTSNELNEYETISTSTNDGSRIQVARNTDDRDDLLERFRRIILIVSGLVIIFGGLGGYIFSNQVLSPIRNLIQIMKRVRAGELNARVPSRNSNDELDEISELFNKMTDKIERVVINMQESLDQVAHDIKTPLTRLKASAELALLKDSSVIEYKSALADTIENTTEIVSFINSLMDISEAQAGVLKLNKTQLNSTIIINEIIDLYSLAAEEKNIQIEFLNNDEFLFFGDKNRTKQLLANLLDNAIKYSKSGSRVKIHSDTIGGQHQIHITDQGIGISTEDLTRIWDRLFRGQDSKSEKGLGLGLSLVQSICKAHGWKITAQSATAKGSEFTLMIPL